MNNWTAVEICFIISFPLIAYCFYWRWTHRRMLELAKTIPGPFPLPFIGNALHFVSHPEEFPKTIMKFNKQYGQYFRVWIKSELNIFVSNPADIRLLLTSNKVNEKGPSYKYMKDFIGEGLITGGPTWRLYRKIVTPSYNKKSVQIYGAVFNRETKDLVRELKSKDPNAHFDVFEVVLKCTTQCVCQTLMGLSKEESLNIKGMDEYLLNTDRMYAFVYSRMARWWLQVPFIYYLMGGVAEERRIKKIIDVMISDILTKRRRALQTEELNEDGMGVLDRFILDGSLTESTIKLQTFTALTSSQEALAKIISGLLIFLAHLQDWQEKVYNEIIEVLGHEDRDITENDVKKLHNLDMVFKEVLRYLPTAAMIQRTVEEEITINDGKITLPVGSSLVIPIFNVHRDPQYWDEPYKVRPERFSPENEEKRDSNAFIPFSLGAMDCLGRVFAAPLIKMLVARVLRELHLEADGALEDLDLSIAISVKLAKGYNLRVRPRKQMNGRVNAFA